MSVAKILLFASGSGTNVENVCKFFRNSREVKVTGVVCNNPHAGVIDKIKPYKIDLKLITKSELNSNEFLFWLKEQKPDLIVLLGFLLKIPSAIVDAFPHKIVNLHPALLPKFGGKGMYGHHVHEAVVKAGETETGITIHYVNEHYDEGAVIAQFKVSLEPNISVEEVARKISLLEMNYVPQVIAQIIS